MSALFRFSVALVVVSVCATAGRSDDKESVDNPYFKHWSKSKVGATVSLKETTKTPAMGDVGATEEIKVIRHKLVELTAEKAVVETVVIEGEVFGFVESAPTKHIYPAKMNKAVLDEFLQETAAKVTEGTVKVDGKDVKAKLLTGTQKKGDEETAHQIWVTDEVPGGIAKRVRVTKFKGELVAETTIEVITLK